jgi:hypothetical protein
MDIEQDMRTLLRDRADSVAARADLLDAVRARRVKHRFRRRVVTLALATIVLAALPVAVLLHRQPNPPVGVDLAAPVALPDFPLTPNWEPSWVGLRSFRYVTTADGSEMTLRYGTTHPQATTLTVTVTPTGRGTTGEAVDVNGRSGILAQKSGAIDVAWQFSGGWAQVSAVGRMTPQEILQYARALESTPLRMDTPFTMAVLPADARLLAMDRSSMTYTKATAAGVRMTIKLVPSTTLGTVDDQPVTKAGVVIAYRQVDGDRTVKVEVASAWGITPYQVAEIAHGIGVTPIAVTTGG